MALGRKLTWALRPIRSGEIQYFMKFCWRPARRHTGQGLTLLNVFKDFADQRRILDTGDDPQAAATIRTGLDVDGEDALQALR